MPFRKRPPNTKLTRAALLTKHGRLRIVEKRTKQSHFRANLQDGFNWLLAHSSLWLLMFFFSGYTLCYLIFATFWYTIYLNDDSCLSEVSTFNEAFLFSIELQSTIGFGSKYVLGTCRWGIFVMLLQNITGALLDASLLGLIFARITRPDRRAYTLRCSTRAVVCHRDGQRCLLIRIADLRQKEAPLIACSAKLYLLHEHVTAEGEVISYNCQPLDLLDDEPLLALPTYVVHKITDDSPFADVYHQDDLADMKAELIFVLEGTISDLGLTLELRTSYLPNEVLFDYRFEACCERSHKGKCLIDWAKFDDTVSVSSTSSLTVPSPLSPVVFPTASRRSSSAKTRDGNGQHLASRILNGIGIELTDEEADVDGVVSDTQLIPKSVSFV
eukprot:m.42065 g.42065  ORF g.42065 m.42065 type:complete len:386 (-) comp12852_c0_seq7:51-1208(-)